MTGWLCMYGGGLGCSPYDGLVMYGGGLGYSPYDRLVIHVWGWVRVFSL